MITYELIAPNIVVYRWQGRVDMREASTVLQAVSQSLQGKAYIAIVDMSTAKNIPTQIGQLVENVKAEMRNGLRGYVLYGTSGLVESFLRAISLLAPTTYRIAHAWDQALKIAHTMLDDQ